MGPEQDNYNPESQIEDVWQHEPSVERIRLLAHYGELLATGLLPMSVEASHLLKHQSKSTFNGNQYEVGIPLLADTPTVARIVWHEYRNGGNRLHVGLDYTEPMMFMIKSVLPKSLHVVATSGRDILVADRKRPTAAVRLWRTAELEADSQPPDWALEAVSRYQQGDPVRIRCAYSADAIGALQQFVKEHAALDLMFIYNDIAAIYGTPTFESFAAREARLDWLQN